MDITGTSHNPTRLELMTLLHAEAEEDRPRLFAIYGVTRPVDDFLPEMEFVTWGMDFGDQRGAIAWDPDDRSSHHSTDAVGVHRFYQRFADARLVWLDQHE